MPTTTPRIPSRLEYERAAQEYLDGLPLEHFMESTKQSMQREITLESLAVVRARRPDVYVFSELLVQYPRADRDRLGQVVPDNMIVVHGEPIVADGSYDLPDQPVGPLCVLEYLSKNNKRKDYVDNMRKYERELEVPYYLLFDPDVQRLLVFHLSEGSYVAVVPNDEGRLAIVDLDLEAAILDGWVRYWYRGDLLPLPADLVHELDGVREQLTATQGRLDATTVRLDETTVRLDETTVRLDETTVRLDETTHQLATERQARQALEDELGRLRAMLASPPGGTN